MEVIQERVGGPIDMHGARAAERHAASELRAGHTQHIAQDPEQRCIAVDIDVVRVPVDFDDEGHDVLTLINGL